MERYIEGDGKWPLEPLNGRYLEEHAGPTHENIWQWRLCYNHEIVV
jgi:hypothetical protein